MKNIHKYNNGGITLNELLQPKDNSHIISLGTDKYDSNALLRSLQNSFNYHLNKYRGYGEFTPQDTNNIKKYVAEYYGALKSGQLTKDVLDYVVQNAALSNDPSSFNAEENYTDNDYRVLALSILDSNLKNLGTYSEDLPQKRLDFNLPSYMSGVLQRYSNTDGGAFDHLRFAKEAGDYDETTDSWAGNRGRIEAMLPHLTDVLNRYGRLFEDEELYSSVTDNYLSPIGFTDWEDFRSSYNRLKEVLEDGQISEGESDIFGRFGLQDFVGVYPRGYLTGDPNFNNPGETTTSQQNWGPISDGTNLNVGHSTIADSEEEPQAEQTNTPAQNPINMTSMLLNTLRGVNQNYDMFNLYEAFGSAEEGFGSNSPYYAFLTEINQIPSFVPWMGNLFGARYDTQRANLLNSGTDISNHRILRSRDDYQKFDYSDDFLNFADNTFNLIIPNYTYSSNTNQNGNWNDEISVDLSEWIESVGSNISDEARLNDGIYSTDRNPLFDVSSLWGLKQYTNPQYGIQNTKLVKDRDGDLKLFVDYGDGLMPQGGEIKEIKYNPETNNLVLYTRKGPWGGRDLVEVGYINFSTSQLRPHMGLSENNKQRQNHRKKLERAQRHFLGGQLTINIPTHQTGGLVNFRNPQQNTEKTWHDRIGSKIIPKIVNHIKELESAGKYQEAREFANHINNLQDIYSTFGEEIHKLNNIEGSSPTERFANSINVNFQRMYDDPKVKEYQEAIRTDPILKEINDILFTEVSEGSITTFGNTGDNRQGAGDTLHGRLNHSRTSLGAIASLSDDLLGEYNNLFGDDSRWEIYRDPGTGVNKLRFSSPTLTPNLAVSPSPVGPLSVGPQDSSDNLNVGEPLPDSNLGESSTAGVVDPKELLNNPGLKNYLDRTSLGNIVKFVDTNLTNKNLRGPVTPPALDPKREEAILYTDYVQDAGMQRSMGRLAELGAQANRSDANFLANAAQIASQSDDLQFKRDTYNAQLYNQGRKNIIDTENKNRAYRTDIANTNRQMGYTSSVQKNEFWNQRLNADHQNRSNFITNWAAEGDARDRAGLNLDMVEASKKAIEERFPPSVINDMVDAYNSENNTNFTWEELKSNQNWLSGKKTDGTTPSSTAYMSSDYITTVRKINDDVRYNTQKNYLKRGDLYYGPFYKRGGILNNIYQSGGKLTPAERYWRNLNRVETTREKIKWDKEKTFKKQLYDSINESNKDFRRRDRDVASFIASLYQLNMRRK